MQHIKIKFISESLYKQGITNIFYHSFQNYTLCKFSLHGEIFAHSIKYMDAYNVTLFRHFNNSLNGNLCKIHSWGKWLALLQKKIKVICRHQKPISVVYSGIFLYLLSKLFTMIYFPNILFLSS